jgi:hypothetical protein
MNLGTNIGKVDFQKNILDRIIKEKSKIIRRVWRE